MKTIYLNENRDAGETKRLVEREGRACIVIAGDIAMPHLKAGLTIVNTTSVTAYRGSLDLLDYSATKGAIVAFTRSLAKKLADKGIRVNGVAPEPIWTLLIPSTFAADKVAASEATRL